MQLPTDHQQSEMENLQHPLKGKTIVVTRAAGQSGEFRDRLALKGATVIEMPALEIGPPSSWNELDTAIAHLEEFHWLILTSTNGVDYFFERLMAQGKDFRTLGGVKIAVVGKKTSASLQKLGLQPDFIPPNFIADSLVENFPEEISGKKILFPRVETGGREVLVADFTAKGAMVVEVAAYQSGCPKAIAPEAWLALQQRRVDFITFASSKTVQYFCQLLEKEYHQFIEEIQASNRIILEGELQGQLQEQKSALSLLEGVCLASIGPQTSKTCEHLLGRVDLEAREYTLEGLTEAILEWATRNGKRASAS